MSNKQYTNNSNKEDEHLNHSINESVPKIVNNESDFHKNMLSIQQIQNMRI